MFRVSGDDVLVTVPQNRATAEPDRRSPTNSFTGLKERPLKGPLGLYRGFMRLYKGYKSYIGY